MRNGVVRGRIAFLVDLLGRRGSTVVWATKRSDEDDDIVVGIDREGGERGDAAKGSQYGGGGLAFPA